MAEIRVNPTRMELKKLRQRLMTARRGHKLLKDKRDELMRQFMTVVRENKTLREQVEEALGRVNQSFAEAAAVTTPQVLEQALMLPRAQTELTVGEANMMSVTVPRFSLAAGEGGCNYGYAFTSGEMDSAAQELGALLPDLVRLAESEKTAQLLAEEIEKTRRRVNALEYIMIPQLEEGIKGIKMKLDENERGNTTRLMKVKDMMLERQIAVRRAQSAEDEMES